MRAHMKMNMRDHMVALTEAQALVATEAWD
jgi:hypothetical protein